ncbi:MAG: cation-transporting P-type ATPase, partial [Gemmataceae bacterium]|nr:cation-transporting P-type ATPase [Gemmataceae bacterium]
MLSIQDILKVYPQAREEGLTTQQAQDSANRYGVNRLTPIPKEPIWKKFLAKFDEAIIKILLAATLLKTVVDLFEAENGKLYGGIGLGLVFGTFLLLTLLKQGKWIPSSAFALSFALVGLSVAANNPSYEGLAVMVAVALATGVAFISEYRSDREFEALNAQKESLKSKVIRDGEVHTVPLEEVV